MPETQEQEEPTLEQAQEAVAHFSDQRGSLRGRFDVGATRIRTLEHEVIAADARDDEFARRRAEEELQAEKDRQRLRQAALSLLDGQMAEAERALTATKKRTSGAKRASTSDSAVSRVIAIDRAFCAFLQQKAPDIAEAVSFVEAAVHAEREDCKLHGRFLSNSPEVYDRLQQIGEPNPGALHRLFVLSELIRNGGVLAIAQSAAMSHSRAQTSGRSALSRLEAQ